MIIYYNVHVTLLYMSSLYKLYKDPSGNKYYKLTDSNNTHILSKRGYGIIKKDYSFKQLELLKKELLVTPYINPSFGTQANSFPVYLESVKKLYVPKHFGIQKYGNPDKYTLSKGDVIHIDFNGTLRPKQQPVVDAYIQTCGSNDFKNNSLGGIISVGCGFGKTVLALYLISYFKRKTIVVVHKEFLVGQWKERIQQYLPNAKIGRLQGKVIDIENKDIVIAMLQSISMKKYEEKLFDCFGMCIVDECHHIGAEVFSRALPKINSYYTLGLSATPKRKDGLNSVFEWYLGPYVFKDSEKESREVEVNLVEYSNSDPSYNMNEITNYGKICMPKMINNITNYERRTRIILRLICNLTDDKDRQILILSDRRNHLKSIFDYFNASKIATVGYYIGGMKQSELKDSESKQILLGTYSMSSEGMDIPTLNTLILASPKSDIEQSIGRILRKKHHTIKPSVYDICDMFSVFNNQMKKRVAFYKKQHFTLYSIIIEDSPDTNLSEIFPLLEEKELVEYKKRNSKKKSKEKEESILGKGCLL